MLRLINLIKMREEMQLKDRIEQMTLEVRTKKSDPRETQFVHKGYKTNKTELQKTQDSKGDKKCMPLM